LQKGSWQEYSERKANSHTLNQALAEGADEAFLLYLANEGGPKPP